MWRHKWWQTSRQDGLRWYLQQKTVCYHLSRGVTAMQKQREQNASYLLGPGVWWAPGAAPPGWRRSAGYSERWTSSVCRNQSGLAWTHCKHWEWSILSLHSRTFDAGELELLPVFVNEGVESHAITPAGGEVVDVDIGIAVKTQSRAVRYQGLGHVCVFILDVHPPCGLHLAPQEQRVLGWAFLFIVFCLNADVLNLLHTR